MSKPMLIFAYIFFLLGVPLVAACGFGGQPVTAGIAAAMFQSFGCSAACLWGAWAFRQRPSKARGE